MKKKTAAKAKKAPKKKAPAKNWETEVKEQVGPGQIIPSRLARQAPA